METIPDDAANHESAAWVPVAKIAPHLHCTAKYLLNCGRAGLFAFRQAGPRRHEAVLPEVIIYYERKYPGVPINREALYSLMQSTA